ncbi:nucleoside-diphosphate-sugar epimerase [Methanolobus tindarius DSM 2278]|jgi:UDP-glucose 4-epimerase|uniref:Nucleoside-diphosphate-sugar epimerase n=1 Tax=Methanolobus tindarius DSM 2278 TaxID=1090322 RepID=W9DN82_METTI|nr:NAD-dependent epimerase/dehydratase family protein [Methanolobus tindarius]ETA67454.1 nucleoside-diphosphate-sugar epimerase [Methanolobus tindarius DSM 2278]
MMKKALVTGGNGFLGHHIVRELSNRGIETIVFDIARSSIIDEMNTNGKITFVEGNILDKTKLNIAMEGCDMVFHTAAIANIEDALQYPVETMEVNVIGTVNCLEAAREHKVDRFVFASSVYVGGNWGTFYRISKQTGESLCKTYSREFDLDFSIIRYGSLYGREANDWNFLYGVLKNLLLNKEYTYYGSPDSLREYIHIADAARETVNIALNEDFRNKAALITGHQRMSHKEFFNMIQEILGRDIKIVFENKEKNSHYKITPYSFEPDIPLRINLSTYIDINEGILDCLKEVQMEIENDDSS